MGVFYPDVENCPRAQLPTEQDAVVEVFIVIIIVSNQTQAQGPGYLEADPGTRVRSGSEF